MERVIIQVQMEGQGPKRDLEVPAGIPAIELVSLLAQALYQDGETNVSTHSFYIVLPTDGRILDVDKTLMEACIWDGATVILKKLPLAFLESDTNHTYPILSPVVRVGRCFISKKDDCNRVDLIDLGDEPKGKTVHRRHALLTLRGEKWFFNRLRGARNMTRINDHVAQPGYFYPLSDGDRVFLGGVQLWFHEGQW